MTVYARERKETSVQYIIDAKKLQREVIRYMMNEKRVPKKWRYMLARGAMAKASEIVDNAVGSHSVFPNTEEKLKLRKAYLQDALTNCYQLHARLDCMVDVIDNVTVDSLSVIISLLVDEIAGLKKTISNAKVVKGKEV